MMGEKGGHDSMFDWWRANENFQRVLEIFHGKIHRLRRPRIFATLFPTTSRRLEQPSRQPRFTHGGFPEQTGDASRPGGREKDENKKTF